MWSPFSISQIIHNFGDAQISIVCLLFERCEIGPHIFKSEGPHCHISKPEVFNAFLAVFFVRGCHLFIILAFEVADSETETGKTVDVMDCENRSCNDYNDDFRKNRRCGCDFQSSELSTILEMRGSL